MTFSAARELPLLALLAISLFAKAATNGNDADRNPRAVAASVAAMLSLRGMESRQAVYAVGPQVLARGGDCRMGVWEYSPHGTTANLLDQLARPYGPLRYAFRGELYDKPPKVAPLVDFFLWRELRRLGVGAARSPVLAVAASPACDLGDFDWEKVAKVDG